MVGTAQPTTAGPLQWQQKISSSSPSSSVAVGATAASGEEEAHKKNTDCVYFLASPLTCKKGSECEYRHSDIARVNPRDCWYWINGNCLNPKCGFRHPPLEGLMGTQGPNLAGPTIPPSQPASAPVALVSGKQGVACIYFQRGHCNRGNWCPFVHAPNSINAVDNKASQVQASVIVTEPLSFKNTFVGHERPVQEQKVSQANALKPTDLLFQEKPMGKIDSALVKNDMSMKKRVPTASAVDDELRRYGSTVGTPLDDQDHITWSNRVQQPVSLNEHSSMNGKDTEEVSREPSPALEILVDNELRDSDYYREDQFGRTVDHEGRGEYFDGRSADFSSMLDADQDMYHKPRGYDTYELHQGQYSREQRRSLSERTLGRLPYPERRLHGRPESPDQVGESDLRYRLAKQRRANGLRSVINKDYARERFDDRGFQNSHRDSRHDRARQESSLSNRFQGRITRPGRSPTTDGSDLRLDRENEKGRDHIGLSQGRLQLSSRLRDRIKGNLQEDIHIDSLSNRGLRMGSDTISDNNANFAGPKSLAELKSQKTLERNEQHMNDPLGKRKFSKLDYQQQTVGEVSFKGPMPLEEILKRKRGSGLAVSGSGTVSADNEDATWKKSEESIMKNKGAVETQTGNSLSSKNDSVLKNNDNNEHKTTASDVKDKTEGSLTVDGQSLNPQDVNQGEAEDGMVVEDGAEDQELEPYEHGDEDSYYDQGDGEEYNVEEGDNVDPEEEYLDDDDDDDDDDFAKKMGVIY